MRPCDFSKRFSCKIAITTPSISRHINAPTTVKNILFSLKPFFHRNAPTEIIAAAPINEKITINAITHASIDPLFLVLNLKFYLPKINLGKFIILNSPLQKLNFIILPKTLLKHLLKHPFIT